ncbi:MAG: FmdB family zinc ribbon protein [Gemmatimonadaceae bacterium]
MPTYEYRCPDGHDFEKFVQKISLASSELVCPVCGKLAQRRISAGGGLVFKGSGFYITDYGKDGKKDLRTNAGSASSTDKKAAASGAESPAKPSGASSSGESSKSAASKSEAPAAAPAAPSAPKKPGSDK